MSVYVCGGLENDHETRPKYTSKTDLSERYGFVVTCLLLVDRQNLFFFKGIFTVVILVRIKNDLKMTKITGNLPVIIYR